MNPFWIGVAIIAVAVAGVLLILANFFMLWLQAFTSGAKVSFFQLVGMKLRKVDPRTIVLTRIQAVKAGLGVETDQLETHFLSGGHVRNVVLALIAANRARIELPWNTACAIDLAGRDILDAVNAVQTTPMPPWPSSAVMRDGPSDEPR